MKLITIKEASKRSGISRQTLEHWGKTGVLKIHVFGNERTSHWIDESFIDSLGSTMKDIEEARTSLNKELCEIRCTVKEKEATLKDIRREMRLIGNGAYLLMSDFYVSIPSMLESLGKITSRTAMVMRKIIEGVSVDSISKDLCITNARVWQIFRAGCRCASDLTELRCKLEELEHLKAENYDMKKTIEVLSNDLDIKRSADEELRSREEKERMRHIVENDATLSLLRTRLSEFGTLSVRVLNCLASDDIYTVGELCSRRRTEILSLNNLGHKSFSEILDFVEGIGLDLDMDVDELYRERLSELLDKEDVK